MKKYVLAFFRRGFIALGFGPIVLAIIFLILQQTVGIETLTVNQVCVGIFSSSALAFMAGGMNAIYQIESLPLMVAILIHGSALYICYLIVYLINGWLQQSLAPILIFTVVFVLGYLLIWAVIYSITKRNAEKLNKMLKKKQENPQK